ncbi:Bug family tripartite tricarboxylate transporter substrate binding protein [Pontitalea aquivivens]|uniref:Bug family tripartite tricarboxylate transporter substrate binding protein n=1 Tax=Pontitalea aquivivens TaxID=3388663 RepID=UPI0039708CBD
MIKISRRTFSASALAALTLPRVAFAQGYPAQAVRVVVPFGPGGSTDAVTLPVLSRLTESLGQPFVVSNLGGAGSVIGTTEVADAAPDGHTILSTTASFVTSQIVQNTTYTLDAFAPVAMLCQSPFLIMVPKDSPAQTIEDLVRMAQESDGDMFYATAGIGSSTHFASEYFNMVVGSTVQHVPYDGIGSAMLGVLGGDVQMIITTHPSASAQLADGSVRLLAYTSDGKPADAPDAPTMREAGFDYDVASWWAMFAPAATPREILEKLNTTINEILRSPEIAEIYATRGTSPSPMGLDELWSKVRNETESFKRVAEFAGLLRG